MAEEYKNSFVDKYPYIVYTEDDKAVYAASGDVHYEPEGETVIVESLTVTENDTYTAPEGKAYSPVVVNVTT